MSEGAELLIPLKSGEGRFVASQSVVDELEGEGRVVFRYADNLERLPERDCWYQVGQRPSRGSDAASQHATEPLTGPSDDGLGMFLPPSTPFWSPLVREQIANGPDTPGRAGPATARASRGDSRVSGRPTLRRVAERQRLCPCTAAQTPRRGSDSRSRRRCPAAGRNRRRGYSSRMRRRIAGAQMMSPCTSRFRCSRMG